MSVTELGLTMAETSPQDEEAVERDSELPTRSLSVIFFKIETDHSLGNGLAHHLSKKCLGRLEVMNCLYFMCSITRHV